MNATTQTKRLSVAQFNALPAEARALIPEHLRPSTCEDTCTVKAQVPRSVLNGARLTGTKVGSDGRTYSIYELAVVVNGITYTGKVATAK